MSKYKMADHFDIDGAISFLITWTDDMVRAGAFAIRNHDKLTEQVAELKGLLSEMNEYLNTNELANIENSSIFHKQMAELLTRIGEDDE